MKTVANTPTTVEQIKPTTPDVDCHAFLVKQNRHKLDQILSSLLEIENDSWLLGWGEQAQNELENAIAAVCSMTQHLDDLTPPVEPERFEIAEF